jgi:energy-coupling factor transport system ATP-binding protein
MKEGALFECGLPAGDGLVPPPPPPAPSRAAALCVHCEALEVRSVDGRALLEALSLSLREGERVLVAGPNGAGKSTLLRAIAGLVPPSGGRLRVEAGAHRAKPGAVALLFQHPQRNLFERCVADEVAFTLRRRGWDSAACERRVGEVLSLCALGPLRGRSPLRLSFGEQHRVALAAVLAAEPGLLLLDEPFSGLDPETRQRMLEVVAREQQRTGMAVLVASHDRHPLEGWVHRCIELVPGNAADA